MNPADIEDLAAALSEAVWRKSQRSNPSGSQPGNVGGGQQQNKNR